MSIGSTILPTMQGIVRGFWENKQKVADPSTPIHEAIRALKRGVWYPTDHKQACLDLMPRITPACLLDIVQLRSVNEHIHHGYAPPKYFKQAAQLVWELKAGKSASQAIKAAIVGLTLIDCGGACSIALYKGLLDDLGPDKFDSVFNRSLKIGYFSDPFQAQFFEYIYHPEIPERLIPSFPPGALVAFGNHEWYAIKHPFGTSGGFNLIADGEGNFIGLGFPPEGVSEEGLCDFFVREFNLPPNHLGHLASVKDKEFMKALQSHLKLPEELQLQVNELQITQDKIDGLFSIRIPKKLVWMAIQAGASIETILKDQAAQ